MRKRKNFHWSNYIYKLPSSAILTNALISKVINDFWNDRVNIISSNQHIISIFRIEEQTGIYSTLCKLITLNKNDKEFFITYVKDSFSIKSNDYKTESISKIIISYGIRDGKIETKNVITPTKQHQNYKHYKLPITMDPLKYGANPIYAKDRLYIIPISPLNVANITVSENKENNVEIVSIKNGNIILSYKDKKINEYKFERFIGKNHYIFIKEGEDYKLDLFTVMKPAKKFKSLSPDKKVNDKIITMDCETLTIQEDGIEKMIVYLLSWYDGYKIYSYYLTDFNNSEEMIKKAIKDIMKVKYQGYNIYLHNFAKFDAIFLLSYLTSIEGVNISPIINKGRIISIKLSFKARKDSIRSYSIQFKDSIQLLLTSLKKLAKYFNVEQKDIFPYKFVTINNLNYKGAVPSIEYFNGISLNEYNEYINRFNNEWNLREQAISYCRQDCLSLYQVMTKFNEMIFNLYKINISKTPTLPSLALKILRTHYLPNDVFIPMLAGKIAKDIKESFTGGATDMYIPSNNEGELIYGYDVNSLYPYIMAHCPMPVGKPVYFEGDIRKYEADAFGFFYCRVTTPGLEHPLIQLHVKTPGGMRTIAPLGSFETMITSIEMDNAKKLGYTFEVLWGYSFKKAIIFKDFIYNLYNLRIQYPKDHPMSYIPKIIMNSSYGRMAMDDNFTNSLILSKDAYSDPVGAIKNILDIKDLGTSYLVEVSANEIEVDKTFLDNGNETHNVNVGIASAITAAARVYMSKFKNNPALKLFYSDTDSIYTNLNPDQMNELFKDEYPNGLINSTGLGLLKLENISTKAIFIAPKCYYLKTVEGKEIIKVKGLNKDVPLNQQDFEKLLFKDNKILKSQDKWFKSLEQSTIFIKNQVYTVQQTENKRQLIYNNDNKLIATQPFRIDKNKQI